MSGFKPSSSRAVIAIAAIVLVAMTSPAFAQTCTVPGSHATIQEAADDPGCANADDLSEHTPLLVCDDGIDNDGDTLSDYPIDPGCSELASNIEDPRCQDGINNDPVQDDLIDFDGGLSALGYVATDPDPQCVGKPWKDRERKQQGSCGLGSELALLLPPLMWLSRRRRRV